MNERIKALAEQADFALYEDGNFRSEPGQWINEELEKFAELVLLECARVVKASSPQGMIGVNAIRIHFGVEP
jgi:hypothetical protein